MILVQTFLSCKDPSQNCLTSAFQHRLINACASAPPYGYTCPDGNQVVSTILRIIEGLNEGSDEQGMMVKCQGNEEENNFIT